MNPRNTWFLVMVAAGLFAFIYFVERPFKRPAPVVQRVWTDMSTDLVTAIEISPKDSAAIRVERTNGQWQMTKPVVYPVQSYAVDSFLQELAQLMPRYHLGAKELQSHRDVEHDFGFDTPAYTILIQQGDNNAYQLKLGNSTAPGDELYAQVVGKDGVEVIGRDFLKVLPFNADEWRDTTFAHLTGTNIDHLVVTSAGGTPIEFQINSNRMWTMTKPIRSPAKDQAIRNLVQQTLNARVTHFISGNLPVDLPSCGLQPPQVEVDLKDGTNLLVALQFGRMSTNGEELYARAGAQAPVVMVARGQLDSWRANLDDFRDHNLVSVPDWLAAFRTGFSIDALADGGRPLFSVRCHTNGTVTVSGTNGDVYPVEESAAIFFAQLKALQIAQPYSNSAAIAAKDIVPPDALGDYGLAETNYVRRYEVKYTPVDGPPSLMAKLDFGLPNPAFAGTRFVRRGHFQEDAVYVVREADFDRLPTRALDFRSRAIWDFDATNVKFLTVSLNGRSHTLEHRGELSWVLATNSVGISNDEKEFGTEYVVENLLGKLRAETWVAPVDKEPPQLGFSELSLQLNLAFKDDQPPRRIVFGGPAEDGGRYAIVTLEGKPWLFIFSEHDWSLLNQRLWKPMGLSESPKERPGNG